MAARLDTPGYRNWDSQGGYFKQSVPVALTKTGQPEQDEHWALNSDLG